MEKSLVSVIIPTYSRPDKLKEAIISVFNQSYKQLEIVVVDDNPPNSIARDETTKLIRHFNDGRIIYVCHEINRGANAARNTGIINSSGAFIAFLDDDDRYFPTKIEEQVQIIESYSDRENGVLVFAGSVRVGDMIYSGSKWMSVSEKKLFFPDQNLIYSKNYIGSNSYIMIERNHLVEVGGFDDSLASCQDWDLFIRLGLKGVQFVGVNLPLVEYHSHEGERITNDKTKKVQGHLSILNKHSEAIAAVAPHRLNSFYRYLYYQVLTDNSIVSKMLLFKIKSTSKSFREYVRFSIDYLLYGISGFPRVISFLRIIKNKLSKEV